MLRAQRYRWSALQQADCVGHALPHRHKVAISRLGLNPSVRQVFQTDGNQRGTTLITSAIPSFPSIFGGLAIIGRRPGDVVNRVLGKADTFNPFNTL